MLQFYIFILQLDTNWSNWVKLENFIPPEPEPSLTHKAQICLSLSRAQPGNSKPVQAQAEPRSKFDFFSEPSQGSPAQDFWLELKQAQYSLV